MVPAPIPHRQHRRHQTHHQYNYARPPVPPPTLLSRRPSAPTHSHRMPSLLALLRSLLSSSLNRPTSQKQRQQHRQRAPSFLIRVPSTSGIQSRPLQYQRAQQSLLPSSKEVYCTRSSGIEGVEQHSVPIMTAQSLSLNLREPQNSITTQWTRSSGSYSRQLFAAWVYIAVLLLAPLALLNGTESFPLQSDDLRISTQDMSNTVAMNLSTIDRCDSTAMTGFSGRQSYVSSEGPIRLIAINHGMN